MSQNRPDNDTGNTGFGSTGTTGTGAGATNTGGTDDSSIGLAATGIPLGGGAGAATATAPDKGIAAKAKEYGQTVADAASTAKDYITEKASVVGEKIQDLRSKDYGQIADEAKDYARQNPGQALLIAAAAGFVIGLLVRGGRR
ncbi:MAG TPA: hypothetical protein VIS78_06560 [Blastocatellia bacterium]